MTIKLVIRHWIKAGAQSQLQRTNTQRSPYYIYVQQYYKGYTTNINIWLLQFSSWLMVFPRYTWGFPPLLQAVSHYITSAANYATLLPTNGCLCFTAHPHLEPNGKQILLYLIDITVTVIGRKTLRVRENKTSCIPHIIISILTAILTISELFRGVLNNVKCENIWQSFHLFHLLMLFQIINNVLPWS